MYCHLVDAVTESSKGHSTILSSQLIQDSGEHGKTSEFHEHGATAALILLLSELLEQKQCSVKYHDSG